MALLRLRGDQHRIPGDSMDAYGPTARQLWVYARDNWGYGLVGGVGTLVSYGLALWAMTLAPVAMVSSLRETSILFGVLISAWVLRERVNRRRWMSAGLIVAGAVVLRVA